MILPWNWQLKKATFEIAICDLKIFEVPKWNLNYSAVKIGVLAAQGGFL
jgi:hypothetical protein